MMRIAFLCSGGGGNLRFVDQMIDRAVLKDATLCGVVADRECEALAYARSRGLEASTADFSGLEQEEPLAHLSQLSPDVVVTNVHKILRPRLLERFGGRLINLHYSLLPAFGGSIGIRPVQGAVAFGCRFAGATSHVVDEEVDAGRPLVQAVFPIFPGESAEDLMDTMFRAGCVCLHGALESRRRQVGSRDGDVSEGPTAGSLEIQGRPVLVNPMPRATEWVDCEELWLAVKAGVGEP